MFAANVTVLVVGFNSDPWLSRCFSTLAQACRSKLHLCVVDNMNNPGLETMDCSAFDLEVIRTPRPMGFADANNYGIRKTRFASDFTVLLNQDTVSTPGWIDVCLECFGRNQDLAILSPGLRNYELSDWEPNLVACVHENHMSTDILETSCSDVIELHQVTAAAAVIRSDVLHEVGPFDPVFGSYYEDYDLCRRVRNAGYTIGVCPAACVGHFSGSVTSTPAEERRRTRILVRNRLIHKVRESADGRLSVLVKHLCFTLPISLIRGLMRTESSQPISAILGAHWDLIKIADRLVSRQRDESCWKEYLAMYRQDSAVKKPNK